MLNEDKVKLMSKMAMFENNEGKEAIRIDSYTKRDYVFLQVIKTWVLSTIGFALVFLLTLLLCIDFISTVLSVMSLTVILLIIIGLYILCIVMSILAARRSAFERYDAARETMDKYREYLSSLEDMYKSENSL